MQSHRKFAFIVFLANFLVADGFVYENARFERHIKCGTKQFQCNNDECIDDWNQCDGVDNCDDGSDETAELCGSLNCPPFSFKCAYGACIYANLQCNGVKNCKDNSDEEGCSEFLRLSLQAPIIAPELDVNSTGNDCVLPEFPDHGKWLVLGMVDLLPGSIVSANTVLMYSCQKNYKLMPYDNLATCNKTWNSSPKCIKTCPTLFGNNLTFTCSHFGSEVSCNNPYEGTRAKVRCTNLYEVPSEATGPFRFCNDGSWDDWQLNCEQVCGLTSVKTQNLGLLGKDHGKDVFPWNVGIYKHMDQICGGTLISLKLVLTASGCFLESSSTEIYLIAAGKYYRALNNTNDDQAQYSKISTIIKDDFKFNFAVIVLAKPLKITKYVRPVCLDFSNNFEVTSLINKIGYGTVFRWSDNLTERVEHAVVDYMVIDECTNTLRDLKLKSAPGKSYSLEDYGGGLVFPGDNGLYFLRGVLTVLYEYPFRREATFMYTSVQHHANLIKQFKSKYPD